ncbi:MFS sugar transporter [Oleoguttula sp. CCFEE 5521]
MALKGLFSKKDKSSLAPSKATGGDDTTLAPSSSPSLDNEKMESTAETTAARAQSDVPESDMNAAEKKIAGIGADEEAAERESEEDNTVYPKKMQLFLITVALCLSVFCFALDNTIIATAIPKITDEFHAINDVGWYGSAYLLTTCAFQLMFGKFYTFFNIKYVYLTALLIFEIGSAVCGAAPNSTAFIIGRAVAGLGSAGIFSGAILIVANTVPLRQRPTYTGGIGAMYGLASVAGPLMGGAFTDRVTWRLCFYINLPLGFITCVFIWFFYNPSSSAQAKKLAEGSLMSKVQQFDIFGTIVFLPMIVCLLLALQWGGSKYPWKSGRIIALLVIFALLLVIFIGIQLWKKDHATVPPRIIKQRTVAAGAWFGAMVGASFFSFVYYLPIWFQAIKGASAVQSGIMNLPLILGLVIISVVAGGLVTALGYYTPFVIASAVVMSIGAGMLTTLKVDTNHSAWIGYQALFGIGVGMGMQQTLIAVQTVLPKADVPIGTAIAMFSQTLGGALFISVAQNVFTNSLLKNVIAAAPGLDKAKILSTGATNLKNAVPIEFLPAVQMAYNSALRDTFYVGVATAVASILGAVMFEWKSVKGKKIEMAAA